MCPSNFYKPLQGNHQCNVCPGDISTATGTSGLPGAVGVDNCICRPGHYAMPGTGGANLQCVVCPPGTDCDDWGYTLAQIGVRPGFWRADATSPYVVPCITPKQCIGAAIMRCPPPTHHC